MTETVRGVQHLNWALRELLHKRGGGMAGVREPRTPPPHSPSGKTVFVTMAEVNAARLGIELADELGLVPPKPESWYKIANAEGAPAWERGKQ